MGKSSPSNLKFVQINLKHSKTATANLQVFIIKNDIKVCLIQEPWVRGGKVMGLSHKDYIVYYKALGESGEPRSCILMHKSIKAFLLGNFSDVEITAVRARYGAGSITLVSAYFKHDGAAPPDLLIDLMENHKLHHDDGLVVGCDANSRHVNWGSTKTNERGENVFDFIIQYNLFICNKGSTPTFHFPPGDDFVGWSDVIDITLSNNSLNYPISNWRVNQEDSFSDHKYITFETLGQAPVPARIRNPKKTDWEKFSTIVKEKLDALGDPISSTSVHQIEESAEKVKNILVGAFNKSCKVCKGKDRKLPPFFTPEILALRRKVRSQYNTSSKSGDWTVYRTLLTEYKKELRAEKRRAWTTFCESVDSTNEAARLRKILSKSPTPPSFIQKDDGSWAESSSEMNQILLDKHFPGCKPDPFPCDSVGHPPTTQNMDEFISTEKVIWAIHSFDPFKSPGDDGIIPMMLQKADKIIAPYLSSIYKDCLKFNYIPTSWKVVKVVFIPKAGKLNHSAAKDFRPISLSSFVLKTMERILDQSIRSLFTEEKISKNQHAYLKGKSVDTALHEVVKEAEKALYHNQYALAAFLDIEGAFNNVTTEAIREALNSLGVDNALIRWIGNMLNSRIVISNIGENSTKIFVNRGTPQGGVLSPLLWVLVVNKILKTLDIHHIKVIAYADDVAIVITGLFPKTICNRMNKALRLITDWTQTCGLGINPSKTELMFFTRRQLPLDLVLPVIGDKTLTLSNEAKYLGVILDSKLNWYPNMVERAKKGLNAFYACKKAIGKSWGLSSKLIMWLYTAVVRPIMFHGAVAWWKCLETKRHLDTITKVQRQIGLTATGALRSTATECLSTILALPPLDEFARYSAANTAVRLRASGVWTDKTYGHTSVLNKINLSRKIKHDYIIPQTIFGRAFDLVIPVREEWTENSFLSEFDITIFTDGSKSEMGCGAGFYVRDPHTKRAFKLPDDSSIFQCEIFAIDKACDYINQLELEGKSIAICVDSQAALKALTSYSIKSKVVLDCFSKLNEISSHNLTKLIWVPGHSDVEGNEIADTLAKQGSELHRSWTNNIPTPLSQAKAVIKSVMEASCQRRWSKLTTCETARATWPRFDTKSTEELLSLGRRQIRRITYAVSGHWPIGIHGLRLKLQVPEKCSQCDTCASEIDPLHFWGKCPALAIKRYKFMGSYYFDSLDAITNIDTKSKFKFILKTQFIG